MIHKIICIVKVDAPTEEQANKKIQQVSNFERWFGVEIEIVKFKKKGKSDGSQDRKSKDPMPAARAEVRRTQGTPF